MKKNKSTISDRAKMVESDLLRLVRSEDVDIEEAERTALEAAKFAESATKKAIALQGKYYETMKSLHRLSPSMAVGTLESLKELATQVADAAKQAASEWEKAEKVCGVTTRTQNEYKRVKEQYYYAGGEWMLRPTESRQKLGEGQLPDTDGEDQTEAMEDTIEDGVVRASKAFAEKIRALYKTLKINAKESEFKALEVAMRMAFQEWAETNSSLYSIGSSEESRSAKTHEGREVDVAAMFVEGLDAKNQKALKTKGLESVLTDWLVVVSKNLPNVKLDSLNKSSLVEAASLLLKRDGIEFKSNRLLDEDDVVGITEIIDVARIEKLHDDAMQKLRDTTEAGGAISVMMTNLASLRAEFDELAEKVKGSEDFKPYVGLVNLFARKYDALEMKGAQLRRTLIDTNAEISRAKYILGKEFKIF